MGKSIPKPAICYAIKHLGPILHADITRSRYFRMKVTSFSVLHNGTRMAHGQDMETGGSVHRQADELIFYYQEESMMKAIKAANVAEPHLVKIALDAIEASGTAQRQLRMGVERLLSIGSVMPTALAFDW